MDLTAAEIRVLGCLLEKQRTTPDVYPLTLNALRAACNQSTNRDPVVSYDEATVRDAVARLSRRRWARLASGAGSRASKYRHLLDEALTRAPDELAVLCVLMLRGPQTPGELKGRTERLHPFADLAAVHETLERLVERDLVRQLPRRPGQKEERYAHRLSDDDAPEPQAAPAQPPAAAAAEAAAEAPPPPVRAPGRPMPVAPERERAERPLADRVARLEAEVVQLRAELRALRGGLSARRPLGGRRRRAAADLSEEAALEPVEVGDVESRGRRQPCAVERPRLGDLLVRIAVVADGVERDEPGHRRGNASARGTPSRRARSTRPHDACSGRRKLSSNCLPEGG